MESYALKKAQTYTLIHTFFVATMAFTEKEATLVGLIAFLVTLWINEGLSLSIVSLLPIVLLLFLLRD